MSFDPVLVGIDFAPASLAAARHACALAGSGTVRLLHVVDTELAPHHAFVGRELVDRLYRLLVEEGEAKIKVMASELAANGSHLESSVRTGRPADELVRDAQEAGLVVVGSHSREGFGRWPLGSVAEEVARRSSVPVLVVREDAPGPKIDRVLVAVDVTETIPEAIEAASAVASTLGVRLEAIHVIPWSAHLLPPRPGDVSDLESRIREEAPRAIRSAVSKSVGRSATVHVVVGSPAAEILRNARPTDILVTGTHGRSALGRLAFGSVATKLLRDAPCPVLVVRHGAKKSAD